MWAHHHIWRQSDDSTSREDPPGAVAPSVVPSPAVVPDVIQPQLSLPPRPPIEELLHDMRQLVVASLRAVLTSTPQEESGVPSGSRHQEHSPEPLGWAEDTVGKALDFEVTPSVAPPGADIRRQSDDFLPGREDPPGRVTPSVAPSVTPVVPTLVTPVVPSPAIEEVLPPQLSLPPVLLLSSSPPILSHSPQVQVDHHPYTVILLSGVDCWTYLLIRSAAFLTGLTLVPKNPIEPEPPPAPNWWVVLANFPLRLL